MAWHEVIPRPNCGHMGVNFQRLAWLVGGLELINTAYTWWWNLHFQTANICAWVFFPVKNLYSSRSMPAFKPWSVCNWWHCFVISWSFCKTLASCRSVWSLLYFFSILYLGVLADRLLFLCQLGMLQQRLNHTSLCLMRRMYRLMMGMLNRLLQGQLVTACSQEHGEAACCDEHSPHSRLFFTNLRLFGAQCSLSPRCPISLPRHLWAQIWIYRSCSYQCSWDFQCSDVWLPR